MKIRMKTSVTGAGGLWQCGRVVDVDAAEAKRLIAAGFAEPVKAASAAEHAEAVATAVETTDAPEPAEKPARGKRSRKR